MCRLQQSHPQPRGAAELPADAPPSIATGRSDGGGRRLFDRLRRHGRVVNVLDGMQRAPCWIVSVEGRGLSRVERDASMGGRRLAGDWQEVGSYLRSASRTWYAGYYALWAVAVRVVCLEPELLEVCILWRECMKGGGAGHSHRAQGLACDGCFRSARHVKKLGTCLA